MRVLGVDPGLAITGWGVVEDTGSGISMIDCGYVGTPAKEPIVLRLAKIHDTLKKVMKEHNPEAMAIEELFFTKHTTSIFALGQARGVILHSAHTSGLEIYEYNPRSIKIAITGFGSAQKTQMQEMVKMLLRLDIVPKPDDVADALAAGICHINSGSLKKRIEAVK